MLDSPAAEIDFLAMRRLLLLRHAKSDWTGIGLKDQTKRDVHILLVVGHNPGLRDLAELLIASGDVDARQRLLEKFPTAGLAVIDFPVDDWGKLHPKSGRLDRFVAPRRLDMATD